MVTSSLPLLLASVCLLTTATLIHAPEAPAAAREYRWTKAVLDTKFRSEGVAVADVNRDGQPDVLTGDLWYEAPAWKVHEIRPPKEYNGANQYSNCFLCFALDVDRDGWTDEVVVGFPGEKSLWYRNPGNTGAAWAQYLVAESACNETPNFIDLDGDGQPELVAGFQDSRLAFYQPGPTPQKGWQQYFISGPNSPGSGHFSHGLGVGDVNGDGRKDVLCTEGYYEAPVDRKAGPWKWVPAKLGPACANMQVFDFNHDGLPDVMTSSAHNRGVWWWEQVKGANGPEFKQHLIDESFTESHSLMTADINRDGRPDFVTGKRWWAHGPSGDPDAMGASVLYWYEFRRKGTEVTWTRHLIDNDSGVGTQFAIADMNRDGRPAVVISNKKGVFVFTRER